MEEEEEEEDRGREEEEEGSYPTDSMSMDNVSDNDSYPFDEEIAFLNDEDYDTDLEMDDDSE